MKKKPKFLRIDDEVIFKKVKNKKYAWILEENQKYIIVNRSFNDKGDMYYAVKDINDFTTINWFDKENFITIQEYRKKKLKKLNERKNRFYSWMENVSRFISGFTNRRYAWKRNK